MTEIRSTGGADTQIGSITQMERDCADGGRGRLASFHKRIRFLNLDRKKVKQTATDYRNCIITHSISLFICLFIRELNSVVLIRTKLPYEQICKQQILY